MVATDVASRGIGMIKTIPLPPRSCPMSLPACVCTMTLYSLSQDQIGAWGLLVSNAVCGLACGTGFEA